MGVAGRHGAETPEKADVQHGRAIRKGIFPIGASLCSNGIVENIGIETVSNDDHRRIKTGIAFLVCIGYLPGLKHKHIRSCHHPAFRIPVDPFHPGPFFSGAHFGQGPGIAKIRDVRDTEPLAQPLPRHQSGPGIAGSPYDLRIDFGRLPQHHPEFCDKKRKPGIDGKLPIQRSNPRSRRTLAGPALFSRRCSQLTLGPERAVYGRCNGQHTNALQKMRLLIGKLRPRRCNGQNRRLPAEFTQMNSKPEWAHGPYTAAGQKIRRQKKNSLGR